MVPAGGFLLFHAPRHGQIQLERFFSSRVREIVLENCSCLKYKKFYSALHYLYLKGFPFLHYHEKLRNPILIVHCGFKRYILLSIANQDLVSCFMYNSITSWRTFLASGLTSCVRYLSFEHHPTSLTPSKVQIPDLFRLYQPQKMMSNFTAL